MWTEGRREPCLILGDQGSVNPEPPPWGQEVLAEAPVLPPGGLEVLCWARSQGEASQRRRCFPLCLSLGW